ncbi:serine carboxypeptidase [Suillus occidentalis]|nr:serine carboxypeptidase [Suillus occidentalis]
MVTVSTALVLPSGLLRPPPSITPVFPHYNVRIKKSSDFCDGTVNTDMSYIDIEARHLFFYFFESRNDPDNDDVIFWTTGGPGCSSNLGVCMKFGPCRIIDDNVTMFTVFHQPIGRGAGFSHAEYGESTTEEAAKDIAVERYIPVFAAEIYDQNAMLTAAGITPVNIQSIMIGNGLTDFYMILAACVDTQYTGAAVFPQVLLRCRKQLIKSCLDQLDAMNCQAASMFCETEILFSTFRAHIYALSGKNPYNIGKDCDGPIEETMCYPITKYISSFLNRPFVREKLGVDPSITGNFSFCSDTVRRAFVSTIDEYHATDTHVAALERGVRGLVFVDSYDWFCNWIGVQAWTSNMDWGGKEAFVAGKTRNAKGLATVPYDKPKEALAMVRRWLAGSDL